MSLVYVNEVAEAGSCVGVYVAALLGEVGDPPHDTQRIASAMMAGTAARVNEVGEMAHAFGILLELASK
jgi:hypothetical protein